MLLLLHENTDVHACLPDMRILKNSSGGHKGTSRGWFGGGMGGKPDKAADEPGQRGYLQVIPLMMDR